jgi:MscS family membrane protein
MNMKHITQFLSGLSVVLLVLSQHTVAYTQEVDDPNAAINTSESFDGIDQRTPLGTMRGFLRNAEIGDYDVAAEYLDLRYLPDELNDIDGAVLAEKLYVIITRVMQLEFDLLSDRPDGVEGDGLAPYRDVLGNIKTKRGKLSLYLQLVPGENETQIWKVSNASVAQIPKLYDDFGYSPFVEYVRDLVPGGSILGVEAFKWVFALSLGALGAVAWLGFIWLLYRFALNPDAIFANQFRSYLSRPISAVIVVGVTFFTLRNLGLGITAQRVAEAGTLKMLAIGWFLFATTDLLQDMYREFLRTRNRESGLMLLGPIATTTKAILAILLFVIWLDNLDVNVTALVAGLGVGGLAVALVLQKPLEDLMGAITLYTQQPVSIGQLCTCGDVTGTVEEISLRTTRIRTLFNTVVVIPNAIFATASIENIAARQRILHRQTVRLDLDTSESMLVSVLEALRTMLTTIEKTSEDSSRVRLVVFGEFSIDIEVFAHIGTTDWAEFLAIAENINLGTVGVLEKAGAKFAEPPR